MGFLGAEIGSPNTYSTLDNVKSQQFQSAINRGLGAYNSLIPQGNNNYNSWLGQFTAGNPAAAANTAQEQGAIGGYYNGNVANQLAALATGRQAAVLNAANLAQQQAIRGNNMSLLEQGGAGMNPYNTGILARNFANISSQAALDNAQQQQQNYQQVLGGQIGLAGQRTSLANALAARALQPYQTRSGMLGQNQGYLNNLLMMNNANNIYGLQMNPRSGVAGFSDNADQGISNIFGMVGSAYSGGKTVNTGGDSGIGNSYQPAPQGGGGFVQQGGFGDYSGPSTLSLNQGQQYQPSTMSDSQVWGSTAMPQFNNTGSATGFGGTAYPTSSAASGFGSGGDALSSYGGGYGAADGSGGGGGGLGGLAVGALL